MGLKTNIEWCDSTVNPTSGCDGCELYQPNKPDDATCYAKGVHENRLAKTLPHLYHPNFSVVRMIPGRMAQAAKWSDLRGKERPDKPWLNGLPRMIFVGDMGDVMSADVTDEFIIDEMFGSMVEKHFYLILTKRPGRLAIISERMGGLPANCMAMTTVTDRRTANTRISQLLGVQCKWRGLSIEPMRGAVDLRMDGLYAGNTMAPSAIVGYEPRLHWVIVGGESGPKARPMHPDWARSLRDQCQAAHVPFFFKQWGEWASPGVEGWGRIPGTIQHINSTGKALDPCPKDENADCLTVVRVGKKTAGRLLDGREWNGMPQVGENSRHV